MPKPVLFSVTLLAVGWSACSILVSANETNSPAKSSQFGADLQKADQTFYDAVKSAEREAQRARATAISKLLVSYRIALKTATSAGKFEKVVRIKARIAELESETAATEQEKKSKLPDDLSGTEKSLENANLQTDPDLQQFEETFKRAADKANREMSRLSTAATEKRLKSYQAVLKQLTKDGQLDDAKTVKLKLTELEAAVTPEASNDTTPSKPLKEIKNIIGMKLVLIPAGEFQMGSPESSADDELNAKPQHRVKISKPFFLGRHEVTQLQWKTVMKTEPWKGVGSVKVGDDYPATCVTWGEAVAFCTKLTQKDGRKYRLPTEAEWEYACRAKSNDHFHFGDRPAELDAYSWFEGNVGANKFAQRVGQKQPNKFGLYDMHGNVWEWCSDWYADDYYSKSPVMDPPGPPQGAVRVGRGGSWNHGPLFCRSAFRGKTSPTERHNILGFRVAASPSK